MRISELKVLIKARILELRAMLDVIEAEKVDGTFELNNSDYYARINELERISKVINDKRKDTEQTEGEPGASTDTGNSDTGKP